MKKFLFIFVALALAFAPVFAQAPSYDEGVLSLTGNEWMNTPQEAKAGFVVGLFFGLDVARQFNINMAQSPEAMAWFDENFGTGSSDIASAVAGIFYDWATIECTTEDLVRILDNFYLSPRNRRIPIFEALLTELGKEWWN